MEQRTLRLGDVVDDYCPRERRITNHAIVAIVGDAIRQTRCTTCDSEHVYKDARVPRRKKKDETAALYDEVLAEAGGTQLVQSEPPAADEVTLEASAESDDPPLTQDGDEAATDEGSGEPDAEAEPSSHDLWLAHRRLIRATLPRTDNDPPVARPIPEFTMHQRQYGRGGQPFRGGGYGNGNGNGWHGQGNGNGNANGNVPGGPRHSGPRHGRPAGAGEPGNGQPGGGRKAGRHRGGRHRRPR